MIASVGFLSERDVPTQRVRCPVHGFIRYSVNERQIMDHPVFQRLRHIRQLAMTYLLYPGAMHSRFEHSLGVMELATQAFDLLALRHTDRLLAELKEVPELSEDTLSRARQILRLMALLHDVGHPAFSHAAESTIPGGDHEQSSIYVINDVLGEQLDRTFFGGAAALLVRLMQKSPELTFLREFVASQMDMDRTDYLRRDSLHCGVDYGVFDSRRLIESLTVIENCGGTKKKSNRPTLNKTDNTAGPRPRKRAERKTVSKNNMTILARSSTGRNGNVTSAVNRLAPVAMI